MSRYRSQIAQTQNAILSIVLLGSAGFMLQPIVAAEPSPSATDANPQIECVTPDGRRTAILHSHVVNPNSAAFIIDDATVGCPLREGETTFVIALPKNALHDSFTFVNENAAACGELKIAVSDSHLSADSPKWTEVDGIIPFSHKRLFNLSMLGVETKFVRLSFHVESARGGSPDRKVAELSATFRSSALASAISSHFANVHAHRADIAASFGAMSVAPLSSTPNK